MNGHLTNLLLNTDGYKPGMYLQYPPGTEYIYSYVESRGGKYPETLFFGLKAFCMEYLSKPFTYEDIIEADVFAKEYGISFNRAGWEKMLQKHKGFLPIQINAVPEGALVKTGVPLITIVNTDPEFYWVVSYIETALLRAIWYPTTVATISFNCKRVIKRYMEKTGADLSSLPFKLHDFGARGVSSLESASLGGMAHLVNFQGSDTISGLLAARKYYGCPMAGCSLDAAEHSTITSWGRAREADAYLNMIKQFGGNPFYAVVSDSYDIYNACENIWGDLLVEEVKNAPGMLVVRPDSGVPHEVVVEILEILGRKFGYTYNEAGYKVLKKVRVIQGDGIDQEEIEKILLAMMVVGWSADNVAFGMGGALLQHCDRDWLKFALKCSAAYIDGKWRDVSKSPVDDASKKSKTGLVCARHEALRGPYYSSVRDNSKSGYTVIGLDPEEMPLVWRNGYLYSNQKFANIRLLADSYL